MKRYTPVIIIEIVIAVAVIGLAVYTVIAQKNPKTDWADVPSAISGAENVLDPNAAADPAADGNETAADGNNSSGGVDHGEAMNDPDDIDAVDDSDGSGGLIGYTEGLPGSNTSGRKGGSAEVVTIAPPDIPTISFPYLIPGTDIVIQQISPYSGYFIEDGSDNEVNGIAAIVLTNKGGDLDFIGIGISQGARSLAFSGSQIPAGATVILQEQTGAAFSNDPYYSATATATPGAFGKAEDLIAIEDNGNGTFSVINISEETLSEVKVFFKNYLPEEDVYVGGITYSITLDEIEPEMAVEVTASHYDPKYTVFVDIRAQK